MKNYAEKEIYRGCEIRLEHDDDPPNPREYDVVGTMCCWHRRYTLGDEQPEVSDDEHLRHIALAECKEEVHKLELRVNSAIRRVRDWGHAWDRTINEAFEKRTEKLADKTLKEQFIILPLYLYDHSGITMRTSAFSCGWDSGQVGFIHCSLKKAQHEWGTPDSAARGWDGEADYPLKDDGSKHTLREAAEKFLKGEVKTYDEYLTGDTVGYIAEDPDGEQIDSCWGFYPDEGPYAKRWDYPLGEARAAVDRWCEEQAKEKDEADYWACRDTVTT